MTAPQQRRKNARFQRAGCSARPDIDTVCLRRKCCHTSLRNAQHGTPLCLVARPGRCSCRAAYTTISGWARPLTSDGRRPGWKRSTRRVDTSLLGHFLHRRRRQSIVSDLRELVVSGKQAPRHRPGSARAQPLRPTGRSSPEGDGGRRFAAAVRREESSKRAKTACGFNLHDAPA